MFGPARPSGLDGNEAKFRQRERPQKDVCMTPVTTDVKKELTPEERQKLILARIGPVQEKLGWPRFTKLTGEMLRKLVDAGAVILPDDDPNDPKDFVDADLPTAPDWDLFSDVFKSGHNQEALAFLEKYPKFMAEGYVGNCGTGTITIDTIVSETKLTRKELMAFANLFHRADEFTVFEKEMSDDGHEKLFAYAWFD
jgi:hypothetical protein